MRSMAVEVVVDLGVRRRVMSGTVPGDVAQALPETAGFDHTVEVRDEDSCRTENVLITPSVSVVRLESPALGGVD